MWPYNTTDHASYTTCTKLDRSSFRYLTWFFLNKTTKTDYRHASQLHLSNPRQFRSVIISILHRAQLAQNWIALPLLVNVVLFSRKTTKIDCHHPSQLHLSNLGRFRSIILSIMNRTQLAQNGIAVALLVGVVLFA